MLWKVVPGPFSRYFVSDQGEIKNAQDYVLLGNRSGTYHRVGLVDDTGKLRTLSVHRLVAEAFHGPPPAGAAIVHHINNDPTDNRAGNLRWVSNSENVRASGIHQNRKARPVFQLDLNGQLVRRWGRLRDVPFNHRQVWKACKGWAQTAYGYRWAYDNSSLEQEDWKTLTFEGVEIGVSNLGRIRLKSGVISNGGKHSTDQYFGVRPNSKKRSIAVHRLVAMAFLLPPPGSPDDYTVNHKNFNKHDNRACNLEWLSQAANNMHAQANHSCPQVFRRAVLQHLLDGTKQPFPSLRAASAATGVPQGNICSVCKGSRTYAGGFRWSYAPTDKLTDADRTAAR